MAGGQPVAVIGDSCTHGGLIVTTTVSTRVTIAGRAVAIFKPSSPQAGAPCPLYIPPAPPAPCVHCAGINLNGPSGGSARVFIEKFPVHRGGDPRACSMVDEMGVNITAAGQAKVYSG